MLRILNHNHKRFVIYIIIYKHRCAIIGDKWAILTSIANWIASQTTEWVQVIGLIKSIVEVDFIRQKFDTSGLSRGPWKRSPSWEAWISIFIYL